MAYCNLSDVQDLTQQVYKVDSRPSINDVTRMIDEIAAELDGVAQSAGYTTPITESGALETMRRYNKLGAAVMAWHSAVISDDEPARVTYWKEQYDAFIGRLRRGEQALPNETPSGGAAGGFSVSLARVDGYSKAWRRRSEYGG